MTRSWRVSSSRMFCYKSGGNGRKDRAIADREVPISPAPDGVWQHGIHAHHMPGEQHTVRQEELVYHRDIFETNVTSFRYKIRDQINFFSEYQTMSLAHEAHDIVISFLEHLESAKRNIVISSYSFLTLLWNSVSRCAT